MLIIWIFVIGTVLATPSDEFRKLVDEGELNTSKDVTYFKHILPSGYSPQKSDKQPKHVVLTEVINKDNEYYKLFMEHVEQGHTKKGLTFNIYDDKMREAAIALFRALEHVKESEFQKVKLWAEENINTDMFEYVWRLASLYYDWNDNKETMPPFLIKPNYFVNAETITKARRLKINDGYFHRDDAKLNQFYRTDNIVTINTNYSEWNLLNVHNHAKYFTEDISLNSYYYGIHLLHPFWMSNDEMEKFNPRHTEHYYFVHRQLLARYLLEHSKNGILTNEEHECKNPFNSYLTYDNGLPFPIRSRDLTESREDRLKIKSIDIAIKEFIARGLVIMANGTIIKMTEDNYVDLMTKLIRANFDNVETAKLLRSLYGYGHNGYPRDEYVPAPSLLHHPETSLRDPVYWYLIQYLLNYFKDYTDSLEPYNLSDFETENFTILSLDTNVNFTTFFDYYQFNINNALKNDEVYKTAPLVLTARQKRLNHKPFKLTFTVHSQEAEEVIIRLFIGPRIFTNEDYFKFFRLDAFGITTEKGIQVITWSSDKCQTLSHDDNFNLERNTINKNMYNLFKFPKNLLLPVGTEDGLELSLFIIITPSYSYSKDNLGKHYFHQVNKKPLMFPFHRQALNFNHSAHNYKFFNISIFHHKKANDNSGVFSPYLS